MNTKIKTIISLIIIFLIVIFAIYFLDSENKVENYDFTDINIRNVYIIWNNTALDTTIHTLAYEELTRRGFFEEKHRAREKEAQEIFNKYSK